jgi:hypothetical protein
MTQIFKTVPPAVILFSFLSDICDKTEKCFIFDKNSYKRAIYNDKITAFLDICKPYYHTSKQTYLDRKLTYNSLITIIRQICNINKIGYASEIKYDKSLHTIVYYIYTNVNNETL